MSSGGSQHPKSVRHKKILDLAEEDPGASLEEIAEKVPSATPDLVEEVLEQCGDPANQSENTPNSSEEGSAPSKEQHQVSKEQGQESQEDELEQTADSDKQPLDNDESTTEVPSIDELTNKQQEVLRVIADYPTATQKEIGDQLDISGAAVSNRVNSIPGFSWQDRQSFVNSVVDQQREPTPVMDGGSIDLLPRLKP